MNKTNLNTIEKDIAVICDYLGDEKKHYEESGRPQNHIWRSVRRIRQWLKDNNKQLANF